MNYGLQHRYHVANPWAATRGWSGLHGLGAVDPNCDAGMPYDVNGNPCTNCASGMPYDESGNPCPGTTTAPAPTTTVAGAPTGSTLLYNATWQLSPSHERPDQILASVTQSLKASASVVGFQVVNASQNAGFTTVSNFNVQMQLFVNGPGFGQPNDAGTFVDHAYNQVTGLMPVMSSTVVTALPSGVTAAPAPTGTLPPFPGGTPGTPPQPQSMNTWFQQNAPMMAMLLVAVVVIPAVIKKV